MPTILIVLLLVILLFGSGGSYYRLQYLRPVRRRRRRGGPCRGRPADIMGGLADVMAVGKPGYGSRNRR
jgi:hypothetical protein